MSATATTDVLTNGEVAPLPEIDPDEIQVDEKLNGRWKPHSEDEIDSLAASIKEHGQLQPVAVRRLEDGALQLVFGYRRYLAVTKLNKGRRAENRIKLKYVLMPDATPEESFLSNITENRDRKSTSPVDDAENQRRLREEFGWADSRIAEKYGCSPSQVSVLKKVLLLPEKYKTKLHKGELALNAAVALVDLSPEEQETVLKPEEGDAGTATAPPAGKGTGKKGKKNKGKGGRGTGLPSTGTIMKRVRGIKGKGGNKGGKPGGKGSGKRGRPSTGKVSRSLAEVKRFFEGLTGPGEKKAVRETAEFILKFISGVYVDDTAETKFNEVVS